MRAIERLRLAGCKLAETTRIIARSRHKNEPDRLNFDHNRRLVVHQGCPATGVRLKQKKASACTMQSHRTEPGAAQRQFMSRHFAATISNQKGLFHTRGITGIRHGCPAGEPECGFFAVAESEQDTNGTGGSRHVGRR
jgi:hypothetical protein